MNLGSSIQNLSKMSKFRSLVKSGNFGRKIFEIAKIIRNCELYNSFSIEFNGFLLFLTACYSMTLSEFGWWRIKKWRFVRNYKLIEKWNFYQGSFQNFFSDLVLSYILDGWIFHTQNYFKTSKMKRVFCEKIKLLSVHAMHWVPEIRRVIK